MAEGGKLLKRDIIEQEAIESALTSIAKAIEPIIENFKKVAIEGKKMADSVGGSAALKDIVTYSKKAKQNTDELSLSEQEFIKLQKQVEILLARQTEHYKYLNEEKQRLQVTQTKLNQSAKEEFTNAKARAAALKKQNIELKQQEATTRLLIQARNTEAGSFERLNAVNNLYRQRMKELNVLIPAQAAQYDRLNKSMAANNMRMMNMGNAAAKGGRQFNMLQWQITQVAREMPAFAYGINVGIGALSNNLPMLFDEINKVRKANKLLAAEGKATTPIFKQIASSIFSWQTALVAIVTLATFFGREIVDWTKKMINAKSALDDMYSSSKAFKEILTESVKSTQDERYELQILSKVVKNTNEDYDNRIIALKRLREIMPDILKAYSDEEILAGKANKEILQYTETIFKRAEAEAILSKVAELNIKQIELGFKKQEKAAKEAIIANMGYWESLSPKGGVAKIGQLFTRMFGTTSEDLQKEITAIDKQITDLTTKFDIEAWLSGKDKKDPRDKKPKDPLPTAKAMRDRLIGLKERELADRAALEKDTIFNEKEREKELAEYKIKLNENLLKNIKMSQKDQLDILDEIEGLKTDIVKKETDYRNKIYENAAKEAEKLSKEGIKLREKESEEILSDAKAATHEYYLTRLDQAKKDIELSRGRKAEIWKIDNELTLDLINNEKKRLQLSLVQMDKNTNVYIKTQERIADLDAKGKEQENTLDAKNEEIKLDLRQKTFEASKDLLMEGFNLADTLYDRQLQRIQEQHDYEIAAAGDSVEKRIMAERKYEKEKKRIMRKQAIAEKAQAALGIALNTAQAIISIWAQVPKFDFGVSAGVLTGIVAGIGALQLASVLMAPIPSFKKGGEHEGGIAKFSEGGKQEIFIPEDGGSPVLTPKKETIAFMPAGTFLPADQTQKMLANYAINQSYDMIDMSESNKQLKVIANNTKNKREVFINKDGRTVIKRGYITSTLV